MNYLPIISTLVSFAFTYAVFRRYQMKGGAHLLLWSQGLLLYGLGTLSEVILGFVFNEMVLKLWYLTGAMLTAAWLGQGSMFLLIRKGNWARYLAYILAVLSALAVVLLAIAPLKTGGQVNYDVAKTVSEQYGAILTRGWLTIFLTIILNMYGTLGLVGGALYSAFLFWRKKVLVNRMFGNILIAAGALSPALAGSLLKAGIMDILYLSELAGAVIMFLGFTLATSGKD